MARIVVITHRYDRLWQRRGLLRRMTSIYMLYDILLELQRRGHVVRVAQGVTGETGDAAILHVDSTVVANEYLDYGRSFPLCLNLAASDISKRKVSGARFIPGDGWDGPVIVKSDLNSKGGPECWLNRRARRAGHAEPFSAVREVRDYKVYDSPALLPPGMVDDPALSIERFVAEPEADGFALRFWVFCGDAERCTRHVSPQRLVKGGDAIRSEPVPVPDELRRRRRELGFDYGKFDFVIHDGKTILLDANKTPGRPPSMKEMLARGTVNLANGLEGMLEGRAVSP